MNCGICKWGYDFSGNSRVCGYLLQGGETMFIHNGQINEPCPLSIDNPYEIYNNSSIIERELIMTSNVITEDKLFKLGDSLNKDEKYKLLRPNNSFINDVFAINTNEYRCPKKDEWFLSGAVPAAYRAPNDLSSKYYIASLVVVRKCTILYEIINEI